MPQLKILSAIERESFNPGVTGQQLKQQLKQVFDPPMCCSTGVCGTDINPDLVNFAALLSQLAAQGVKVERFNMGQQPMAFAQNLSVKSLLEKEGTECLPLILIDGEVYMQGRYPSAIERPAFTRAVLSQDEQVKL